MKMVFRVDASVCMGTGHLIRCLTLAEALRQRGVEIGFICRDLPGNLLTLLRQKEIPVTVLPALGLTKAVSGERETVWNTCAYLEYLHGRDEIRVTKWGVVRVLKVKPNANTKALTVEVT